MHILCLSCVDTQGIVAAVATAFSDSECNIEQSAQFFDTSSGQFFMRVVFSGQDLEKFKAAFQNIADQFSMNWDIFNADIPVKTLILVSKPDHCLNDLLYRWRTKTLPIDITGVISNHDIHKDLVESHGLAYHHLPVSHETKQEQELQISGIIDQTDSELIVLARYMQVFSNTMSEKYLGRTINIHHSFLPGFKGAKPYHQAHERGVKMIGATAHFVTEDLDEGPIIVQDTAQITHAHTPDDLVAIGKDIETRVLASAIKSYAERRIFLNGHRTIIL